MKPKKVILYLLFLTFMGAISANTLLAQVRRGTGLELTEPEAFAKYPQVRVRATRSLNSLPDTFSLRDFLPPIGDQGQTDSCVGWATAYYCYSMSVARQRQLSAEERKDPANIFSPGWIWHRFNNGNPNKGMHIYKAFDTLSKEGASSLNDYPWNQSDYTFSASNLTKQNAQRFKARQTICLFQGTRMGRPANPALMRAWLYETGTPFVIGIPTLDGFTAPPTTPGYVYNETPKQGERLYYHAITVIGYDTEKKAFQIVNSWSSQWGDKGTLWVAEEFLVKYSIDGWGQRPGGRKARGGMIEIVEPTNKP